MVTYAALNENIHTIIELSSVLSYLMQERPMLDTRPCAELFDRHFDCVGKHLDCVDNNLYRPLLVAVGASNDMTQIAERYMSGSQEIKRVLQAYHRRWYDKKSKSLKLSDHASFTADTEKVFELVMRRVIDETEHLYPAVREVTGNSLAA